MSNPEPDFPTVIQTSIPSITKRPRNISRRSNGGSMEISMQKTWNYEERVATW